MSADPVEELLARLESGEVGDAPLALAWLAGGAVAVPEDELNAALRRALLLVAAGGDPRRDLLVDDRAVESLAADLDEPARRTAFDRSLAELVTRVDGRPHLHEAALALAADRDLSWRLWALTLLALELAE